MKFRSINMENTFTPKPLCELISKCILKILACKWLIYLFLHQFAYWTIISLCFSSFLFVNFPWTKLLELLEWILLWNPKLTKILWLDSLVMFPSNILALMLLQCTVSPSAHVCTLPIGSFSHKTILFLISFISYILKYPIYLYV